MCMEDFKIAQRRYVKSYNQLIANGTDTLAFVADINRVGFAISWGTVDPAAIFYVEMYGSQQQLTIGTPAARYFGTSPGIADISFWGQFVQGAVIFTAASTNAEVVFISEICINKNPGVDGLKFD